MTSPASIGTSKDQILLFDVENGVRKGENKQMVLLARFREAILPTRRGFVMSDLYKAIATVSTALCIFQFTWIQRIEHGLRRIPNDPYDNQFWGLDRTSPSIWDVPHQSFIQNAIPVPVHSHNDYWRQIPLFEALGSGCISVEADVHLQDSDLLVGHTAKDLRLDSILRSIYLEPLQRLLEERNLDRDSEAWQGIFNLAPQQTIVLLVDHKTSGPETFAKLYDQLQPLRDMDYLTYWNGTERIVRPLTVVATGNASFASVVALNESHRDIFWDANLNQLPSPNDNFQEDVVTYAYNVSNSYFASAPFKLLKLHHYPGSFAPPEVNNSSMRMEDMASSQIDQAKARGLITRYWDTPEGPQNTKEIVWRVLIQANVGVINMDDMGTVRARARGWGKIGM